MITLIPTNDMQTVKAVATTPEIWERFSDAVSEADYEPTDTEREQWLLVCHGNHIFGLIYVYCITSVSLEIHPYLLKSHRKYGREMMRLFYDWYLSEVPGEHQKINAVIPCCFQSVINFAKKVGFKTEGVNRKSYFYQGQYFDQEYLGITRDEVCNVVIR